MQDKMDSRTEPLPSCGQVMRGRKAWTPEAENCVWVTPFFLSWDRRVAEGFDYHLRPLTFFPRVEPPPPPQKKPASLEGDQRYVEDPPSWLEIWTGLRSMCSVKAPKGPCYSLVIPLFFCPPRTQKFDLGGARVLLKSLHILPHSLPTSGCWDQTQPKQTQRDFKGKITG